MDSTYSADKFMLNQASDSTDHVITITARHLESCMEAEVSVWIDKTDMDEPILRVEQGNGEEFELTYGLPSELANTVPVSSVNNDRFYIKYGRFEVHLIVSSEGVIVDVWEYESTSDDADGDCVDTLAFEWSEICQVNENVQVAVQKI